MFLAVFAGILLLTVLVICLRAWVHERSLPVGGDTESTAEYITTDPSPEDTTPVTEPPIQKPTVHRPTANGNTVRLGSEIDSENAILISLSDYTVLAQKGSTGKIFPASMTKVMSLIVAYEHIEDLTDTFTVTSTIIDPLYRAEATLAGFAPGETVTLKDLLYGMILPSGAEASVSLAQYIAGSEEGFVQLMNDKAAEMGLIGTHFTNSTGLHDDNHYSTTVEIAMILDYAMQYPQCAEILSAYRYTTAPSNKHPEGIQLESTTFSRMYGSEPEGVTIVAGKTGYTNEAHHCLVSYAIDDVTGEAYIFVSTSAQKKFAPVFDAITVYTDYTKKVAE